MAAGQIIADITTETGAVIVKCIVRWLYDQDVATLRWLKDKIQQAIFFIDRQIDTLRLILAQADILAKGEEFIWNMFQSIIQQVKDAIPLGIPGPKEIDCPEFYEYIMAPFNLLLNNYTDIFSIYRERWKTMLSFMDEVDYFISYWESTKNYILALTEVMDDAIYVNSENEALAAEQALRNLV